MSSEIQMRQALEIVLREVSKAILQALPEQAKEAQSNSQLSIESGSHVLDGRLLLTVGDAAAKLSLSRSALYRLIMEGQNRSIKIGKVRRIPVSALQEFIAGELQGSR